jgi:anti-sigma B factor antagonist
VTGPAPSAARVVRLAGDLTIQTAAETKATIMAALDDGGDLDLDLSELTELDTAGLQLLLLARREALQLGVGLILSGPPQPVRDVLRTVGLDAALTSVPTHESGIEETASDDDR